MAKEKAKNANAKTKGPVLPKPITKAPIAKAKKT